MRLFALKHGPYLFDDLARSRIPKAIGVYDLSIVDINAELTNSAPYEFHPAAVSFLNWAATREAIAFLIGQSEQ